jgi:hypothetical protein
LAVQKAAATVASLNEVLNQNDQALIANTKCTETLITLPKLIAQLLHCLNQCNEIIEQRKNKRRCSARLLFELKGIKLPST